MSKFRSLKESCYQANMMLPDLDLVIYTFGNVSEVDREQEVFAIKPSGVPYSKLAVEDMVIVDFENHVMEGELRPSSDTKTHAYLYRTWENIGGICHTHSTYAVSWAQAQRDVPILGTTHADYLTHDIPCAAPMEDHLIQGNYEHNTGLQIVDAFEKKGLDPSQVEMVLLGNHGPFTWGESGENAVFNSKLLEELAHMAYVTLGINPDASRMKKSLIQKHFDRKHGSNAYYGQEKGNNHH